MDSQKLFNTCGKCKTIQNSFKKLSLASISDRFNEYEIVALSDS
jgi:hypothetical protein